jgi:hypothetical protein
MMYGKDKGQMSASTMRAISKKKPLTNAGALPTNKPAKKKNTYTVTFSHPVTGKVMETQEWPKYPKPGEKMRKPMGSKMSQLMDKGIRKALRMPGE